MSHEETSNQQGQQGHSGGPDPQYGDGAWQPTPQSGEYDADATAFVQLPPEDLANIPLAAPGHGYVPPMILPLTPAAGLDPAATGSWVLQTRSQQAARDEQRTRETAAPEPDAVHWPDPNQQDGYGVPYQDTSHSTAQWNFTEAVGEAATHTGPGGPQDPAPGHPEAGAGSGHTGQWAVPVAEGDLPDGPDAFPAPAHTPQWYADGSRPATLPGGAPAPWARQEPPPSEHLPEGEPEPEAERAPEQSADPVTEEPGTEEAAESTEAEEPAAQQPELATAADTDLAPDAADPAPMDVPSEHPAASYVLHVNGMDRPVADAWIGESLLYVLRERLGLAGAKDGCSQGECGACNVQVDGRLVASCLVPAATAAGSEVRTVEGLAVDGEPSDVQRALSACGAVQCGFCIPGMAMTVHDLLEGNHAPSELETRQALCGNLCRCSGYRGVLDAVADVVAGREASAEAAAPVQDEVRIPQQAEPGAGGVHQQPHPHEGNAL